MPASRARRPQGGGGWGWGWGMSRVGEQGGVLGWGSRGAARGKNSHVQPVLGQCRLLHAAGVLGSRRRRCRHHPVGLQRPGLVGRVAVARACRPGRGVNYNHAGESPLGQTSARHPSRLCPPSAAAMAAAAAAAVRPEPEPYGGDGKGTPLACVYSTHIHACVCVRVCESGESVEGPGSPRTDT